MLSDMASYLAYLERIRERTLQVVDTIQPDQFDWTPRAGEFTIGDLVRHVASVEQMDVNVALGAGWRYAGHSASEWGATLDAARFNLVRVHEESVARLRAAGDAVLFAKQPDLAGNMISAWRILMAMIEHEIHHRSQLDCYLMLLGVTPPQLFGVTMESLPRD
jgi:uncharacterized damage-inducible protein DinB